MVGSSPSFFFLLMKGTNVSVPDILFNSKLAVMEKRLMIFSFFSGHSGR